MMKDLLRWLKKTGITDSTYRVSERVSMFSYLLLLVVLVAFAFGCLGWTLTDWLGMWGVVVGVAIPVGMVALWRWVYVNKKETT